MPKIFISYRRDDSSKDSARLYDRLRTEFGPLNVFKDLDSIPKGRPFINVIQDAIEESDVVLVIIGRVWASVAKNGQRRLDDPNDFVRREVEMALAAPHKRLVIPTLVDGATMPAAADLPDTLQRLPDLNAATIQDDPHFHTDVSRLIREIRAWKRPSRLPIVAIIGIIAIVAVVGIILLASQPREPTLIDPIAAANTRAFAIQTETARAKAPTPNITQTFEAQLTAVAAYFTDTPTPEPPTPIPPTPEPATPTPASVGLVATLIPAGTSNTVWTPQERDFDGVAMVYVPAGCFLMGTPNLQVEALNKQYNTIVFDAEKPVHEVCITQPFWLDKYEVSNGQFNNKGGQAGHSSNWTADNLPRERITWTEANAFCQLRGARLPTEAEWEYSSRGPQSLTYPWGNDFVADNVTYGGNSGSKTAPIDSRPGGRSWVGAFNLSGNVWEWVSSQYQPYPYKADDGHESMSDNNNRVIRGGSWNINDILVRGAYRFRLDVVIESSYLGFRCARF